MTIVLTSKSPRRRELMALITPHFISVDAGVDESGIGGETPAILAQNLALAKAQAAYTATPGQVMIGCDTVVELEGRTLGKPQNAADAARMLHLLSGKRHLVHTGLCILMPGHAPVVFAETTMVAFAAIPHAEIERYALTPEPLDKAGGYGIQGWAAKFIPHIQGCYYNVMGLPVAALYHQLANLGVLLG